MLDHIGYRVRDIAVSQGFFQRALRPLGITELMSVSAEQSGSATFCGFGANGKAFFWISDGKTPTETVHVAFAAATRAQVDGFYAAALGAGGRDNGAPGLRPHYHPNYYGAFVLDPDGNNIEAVCHTPA